MAGRRVIRALSVVGALACSSLCACTLWVSRAGEDRFLVRELDWELGVTTLDDVTSTFGPPDYIRRAHDAMVFVYRYQQNSRASLVFTYYLNLFTKEQARFVDSTFIVAFDDEDRVVYHGLNGATPGALRSALEP